LSYINYNEILKYVYTIPDVSRISEVPKDTLIHRLRIRELDEGIEVKRIGARMPILVHQESIKKLLDADEFNNFKNNLKNFEKNVENHARV